MWETELKGKLKEVFGPVFKMLPGAFTPCIPARAGVLAAFHIPVSCSWSPRKAAGDG